MKYQSPRDAVDRHGNAASRMPVQTPDDTKAVQEHTLSGFAGEQMSTIEHFHPYGFTAVVQNATGSGQTMESAEGMTIFMGSNRTHGVNIVTGDRRYRLYKLANGEVALHDDQGHQVHIRRDGVYVSAPNSKKVVTQIMDSDTLPQDGAVKNNSGTSLGQVQQAGRPAAINMTLDKNQLTLNHPNGAVAFNCSTFTVNASSDVKLISGNNMLAKGLNAILLATQNAFMKATGSTNVKGATNLADPDWTNGASDPPISS